MNQTKSLASINPKVAWQLLSPAEQRAMLEYAAKIKTA
jgi:hypothetical protein